MAEEARMGDHGTDSKCHVMVTRSETGVRQRKTICLKFCGFFYVEGNESVTTTNHCFGGLRSYGHTYHHI